jgi:hypothetical protein
LIAFSIRLRTACPRRSASPTAAASRPSTRSATARLAASGDSEATARAATALVEAGEDEQVVDRARHPVDLLACALEHPPRGRRQVVGPQAHVDLGAHGRERRAQLVRRVGDQSVLLLDAVGDAIEHRVQGACQLRDLVAGGRHGEAVVDPLEVDGGRPRRHALDRAQGAPRQPPASERGGRQRGRAGDEQQDEDPAHGAVHVGHRLDGDGDLAPAAPLGRARDEPKALAVGAELDRARELAAAQDGGHAGGREHRRAGDRVAEGDDDAPRGVQDLRRGALAGEHADGDVDRLGGPLGAVAVGDLLGGRLQRAVDRVGQVRAQPNDEEGAHGGDDGGEQDHVPRGDARADGPPHGWASSA